MFAISACAALTSSSTRVGSQPKLIVNVRSWRGERA